MTAPVVSRILLTVFPTIAGLAMPILLWGGPSQSDRQLQAQIQAYLTIPAELQAEIEPLYREYAGVGDARREAILQIHRAISANPELQSRLTFFADWCVSHESSELDQIRQEIFREDHSVEDINRRMSSEFVEGGEIIIDVAKWFRPMDDRWLGNPRPDRESGLRQLPKLRLTVSNYLSLMEDAFPEEKMSAAEKQELNSFTKPDELALIRTFQVLDRIRTAMESWSRDFRPGPPRENGGEPPAGGSPQQLIELARGFHDALRQHVQDPAWQAWLANRTDLTNRTESREMLGQLVPMMPVLMLSVSELANRVPKPEISDDQLIGAYAGIDDEDRLRRLMTTPPAQAKEQLVAIATLQQNPQLSSTETLLWRKIMVYQNSIPWLIRQALERGGRPRPGGRDRGPRDRGRGNEDRPPNRPDRPD